MVNIIFEGVDNVGKTTLINKVIERYNSTQDIVLMHATGPKDKLSEGPALQHQIKYFENTRKRITILSAIENSYQSHTKPFLVIQDRSEIGEYVYGVKYRNENPADILKFLGSRKNHNNQYEYLHECKTLIIFLKPDTPEFAANNDDNLSLSSTSSNKAEEIKKEIKSFEECIQYLDPVYYLPITVSENGKFIDVSILANKIFNVVDTLYLNLTPIQ